MTNLVDNWLKDTEMPPIIVPLATMDIALVLALIYRTCPILSFLGRGGQLGRQMPTLVMVVYASSV